MSEIDSGLALEDWQKEWAENAANPAPLHPELVEYLERATPDSKLKWDTLKHPLVFGIPYIPAMNYMYNQQYEAKTEAAKEAIAKENWGHYLAMHERPHRFDAFEAICHNLDGPSYWDLLSWVWSDSENLWQIGSERIKRLLALHHEHRDHFMDADERDFLKQLPDQIRVFRGHQSLNKKGFSWTMAYTKAKWFGQRWVPSSHARVSEGVVRKSDIVGLILGRNELEIVVDPRHVQAFKPMKLIKRSAPFEELRQELIGQFQLGGRTDHGPDHWNKVDRNGVKLCQLVPDADQVVVRLFAIFHDSQRHDEYSDPKHGHRAADLVKKMYKDGGILGITEEQFTKLEYAVRHHNGGKPVADPTVGVCFDADRLDLIRVGIIPNPRLLSTEAAKGLICQI